jgi:3-methyladenine DNA glycosylase AlkC
MPTAKEYRQQAKECLELAKAAKDLYVKEAMAELAEEFSKTAKLLERRAI